MKDVEAVLKELFPGKRIVLIHSDADHTHVIKVGKMNIFEALGMLEVAKQATFQNVLDKRGTMQ